MGLLETDTLIVVSVALFTIVSSVVVVFRKIWPTLTNLNNLIDDWRGEKARPGVPARPGMMERMQIIEDKARDAAYNSKPNSGHSAYDSLARSIANISKQIDDVNRHVSESQKDRINLWQEVKKLQERNNGK